MGKHVTYPYPTLDPATHLIHPPMHHIPFQVSVQRFPFPTHLAPVYIRTFSHLVLFTAASTYLPSIPIHPPWPLSPSSTARPPTQRTHWGLCRSHSLTSLVGGAHACTALPAPVIFAARRPTPRAKARRGNGSAEDRAGGGPKAFGGGSKEAGSVPRGWDGRRRPVKPVGLPSTESLIPRDQLAWSPSTQTTYKDANLHFLHWNSMFYEFCCGLF